MESQGPATTQYTFTNKENDVMTYTIHISFEVIYFVEVLKVILDTTDGLQANSTINIVTPSQSTDCGIPGGRPGQTLLFAGSKLNYMYSPRWIQWALAYWWGGGGKVYK